MPSPRLPHRQQRLRRWELRAALSRGFSPAFVACGERCVRRTGRRHRPLAAASLRRARLAGALRNSLRATRFAQTAAVRMLTKRATRAPASLALLRRCLHGRPSAHTAHREMEVSNGGQIPIQDSDSSGGEKRLSKLDSDPHYAVSRREKPAHACTLTLNPQWGSEPISFTTARVRKDHCPELDLTPIAGMHRGPTVAIFLHRQKQGRNGGQIPIQDSDFSGGKKRPAKLDSDPHYAVSRREKPAPACTLALTPQWGSEPISFTTTRVRKDHCPELDLTPIAGLHHGPTAAIFLHRQIQHPSRGERCVRRAGRGGTAGAARGLRAARSASSTFSLRLSERSAQREVSSAVRPQAMCCGGKPPQAAGDVGRPGAHTAHRRLQNMQAKPPRDRGAHYFSAQALPLNQLNWNQHD
jgi:hypothetical protein